jgi:DNA-binding Xre family transcriptional regulator
MYEQRNKDINKAQAVSLVKIARVLGCEVEDLLEL